MVTDMTQQPKFDLTRHQDRDNFAELVRDWLEQRMEEKPPEDWDYATSRVFYINGPFALKGNDLVSHDTGDLIVSGDQLMLAEGVHFQEVAYLLWKRIANPTPPSLDASDFVDQDDHSATDWGIKPV